MKKYDIIIVGGGAAGMCAAITAKRKIENGKILVIERLNRVGKKLLTTGNGRCNITNQNISLNRFHSSDKKFPSAVLSKFDFEKTKDFFKSIGIVITDENDSTGRCYPASFQAASVVDALRFSLDEHNIEVVTDTTVTAVENNSDALLVITDGENYLADAVILCTGGLAGGEKLGCDMTGYSIAKKSGHSITELLPAITQVKTDTSETRRFKGIKTDAKVCITQNGKVLRTEIGELLFTDYGISGPPVFQLSRSVSGKTNCKAVIDFCFNTDSDLLYSELKARRNALKNRNAEEFLNGFMNKRIGQYFAKLNSTENTVLCKDFSDKQLQNMAYNLKNFTLDVKGTVGFSAAQVTAGGIKPDGIFADTMMSKKINGLFFAGEILDVDGDCGGYNLQWAWSSGVVAAESAVEYRSKKYDTSSKS